MNRHSVDTLTFWVTIGVLLLIQVITLIYGLSLRAQIEDLRRSDPPTVHRT